MCYTLAHSLSLASTVKTLAWTWLRRCHIHRKHGCAGELHSVTVELHVLCPKRDFGTFAFAVSIATVLVYEGFFLFFVLV